MGNTYSQLYIQIVFAVKGRENLINSTTKEALEKYISGIVKGLGSKLMAIYCMPDHPHIFVSIKPDAKISDLVRDIKSNSNKWMNDNKKSNGKFSWQEGFGAFNYSKSQKEQVINYVVN
jgi:REP element-mobilizing transposase RayT